MPPDELNSVPQPDQMKENTMPALRETENLKKQIRWGGAFVRAFDCVSSSFSEFGLD
jgi:hypothetical protein